MAQLRSNNFYADVYAALMVRVTAIGLVSLVAAACSAPAPRSSTIPGSKPANVAAGSRATTATTASTVPASAAITIAPGQPLVAGHVTFTGMAVPTKGGYRVSEAVVDDTILTAALPKPASGAVIEAEWFVGANLQITGMIEQIDAATSTTIDGQQMQNRTGRWFALQRIDALAVANPAVMIEGTLAPSKGFFSLDKYLINRSDLDWALSPSGGKAGERLRLWGQPYVVTCAPNAQCLIGGQLPIFVVGRAQRIAN